MFYFVYNITNNTTTTNNNNNQKQDNKWSMMTEIIANNTKSPDDILIICFLRTGYISYCSSQTLYTNGDFVKYTLWFGQVLKTTELIVFICAPQHIFNCFVSRFSSAQPSGRALWEDQRLKSHAGLSKSLSGSNLKCLSETRRT